MDIIKVDSEDILKDAIEKLKKEEILSVICHKPNQLRARSGPFEMINVGTADTKVYQFNAKLLGEAIFAAGLRDILEGTKCIKLMFDCRNYADTLHLEHNVWLAGVLDIQIMEVMYRRNTGTIENATYLNNLFDSIDAYVQKEHNTFNPNAQAKAYWKVKLSHLFALFHKLEPEADMDQLFAASQRYANYWRSYEDFPHNKYTYHRFLPLNILTDGMGSDTDKQTCGGCEKQFLSEELHQGQDEDGVKKCGVCLEIDKIAPKIVWLADIEDVANASKDIQDEQIVSIICQRHNLDRSGPLDVVFIGTEDCTVYVFDITTLGNLAFDSGLRSVLESQTLVKLMFDCRSDSDTLHKMHGTWLAHVVDVQLLDVLNEWQDISVHRLNGWKDCLKKIPEHSLKCHLNWVNWVQWFNADEKDDDDRNIWARRPLYDSMKIYWAIGTLNMFTLYETFKTGHDMEMVSRASERCVNYARSYEGPDTKYIFHSYLPHNILTEPASLDIECTGCRKKFARNEFREFFIRKGIQKCPVCIKRCRETKGDQQAGTASHS